MKCEKGRMDFRMSIVCSWPEEITLDKKRRRRTRRKEKERQKSTRLSNHF